jgi:hypothetical protein
MMSPRSHLQAYAVAERCLVSLAGCCVAAWDMVGQVLTPAKSLVAVVIAVSGAIVTQPAIAAAQPPEFPNLNLFIPIDPTPYIGGGLGAPSINFHFATPDGVLCRWQYSTSPSAYVDVRCSGNIPGIPDDSGPGCAQLGATGVHGAYVFTRGMGDCPPFADWLRLLDVGQSVTAGNVTCVVGTGNLTACVDRVHNRGFVLQPSGSWVF